MTKSLLKVKSSDGTSSYSVEFNWDGMQLKVSCDCRAGALGQHCRHKDGLLRGDPTLLADSIDRDWLLEIVNWVCQSPVGVALQRMREAEDRLAVAQASAKAAKKSLEKAMRPDTLTK